MRKSIVILASGRGTNFKAIYDAIKEGKLPLQIEAVVSNILNAPVCGLARELGVPVIEVPHIGLTKQEHEEKLLKALHFFRFEWLVLAGYMRLLSEDFIKKFWDEKRNISCILNIHPSLLPAFPGKKAYKQALQYGVKVTGATVHFVGFGVDDGPIVMQRALPVKDEETYESLLDRGLKQEHALYPDALSALCLRHWEVRFGKEPGGRSRIVFGD